MVIFNKDSVGEQKEQKRLLIKLKRPFPRED
ncbi:hypothetical protein CGMCC3_g854 [Colletotrichum fructicola]|nr:uncharacterized protein CGMCC3_g854 [Colletotrichum fructicola]KAE9583203.1 hypothetical protein CGMCC3_g854 [Colletotrichum fructicola]